MMGSGSEGGVTMSQVNQHSVSIADPAEHSAALEIQWIVHGTWPIAAAFAGSTGRAIVPANRSGCGHMPTDSPDHMLRLLHGAG